MANESRKDLSMLRPVLVTSAVLCAVAISFAGVVRAQPGQPPQGHCLGDSKTSSTVSRPETGVVVIAWVIDVANFCAEPHAIRATYMAWGADNVLLQSDQQDLSIAAKARATATGRMRLSAETWARVTHRSGVAQFR
jgi:hypothetical protein